MGDEELINYILRSRERGRTKDQIMRALLSVGWKRDKIESVFRRLDDPNYLTQLALQQSAQSTQPAQPSQPSSTFQPSQQTQPQPTQMQQQAPAQPSAPAQQPQPQPQPQPQQAKPFDLFSIFKKPQQTPKQPQQLQPTEQPQAAQQPTATTQQQVQQSSSQPFQVAQFYSIPSWIAGSPTITVSLSSQPTPPPPPAKQPPIPQKPGLEEFAKNPAFSNLAAAISSSVQSKKSMLPFVLFAIFILLAAAYILTQQGQKTVQPQPETHINLTKLELEKKNATKQNATLKKPIVITQPPPNATNRTTTANQSRPTTPTNASQQVQKNATQAATSAYSKYESSQGFPPSVFCQRINAALYRVHYTEFSDAACTKPTQKQDYVYPIDFPYACDEIPCCYPHGSVSRRYDWFECSHYS